MCCSFMVHSTLEKQVLRAMLDLSGFKQQTESKWVRQFPDRDGVERYVACYYYGLNVSGKPDHVTFNIVPTIGGHSFEEHANAAIEASFILQFMQIIHERGDGDLSMYQNSLLNDCLEDSGGAPRILTATPRRVEQVDLCLGFRSALYRGIGLEYSV